jgi:adenylosuccinate lyase
MDRIASLSPLDGRYRARISALLPFFSEQAFFRYRALVETRFLLSFIEATNVLTLTAADIKKIENAAQISEEDYQRIKTIENKTNHDLKALEYFLREKIGDARIAPFIHFAITSEDTNNIAYSLMISDALASVIMPSLESINRMLMDLAERYRTAPMLARTHGQPASPTTFGKEMRVFQHRLDRQLEILSKTQLTAKLNGATGNYSALAIAFPNVDWITFAQNFIASFNHQRRIPLQCSLLTTQINPPDALAELFDRLKNINIILIDLCQDMWRYISDGWLVQSVRTGEIGSSTMPHKVNPIDFENAEGNLGLANALLMHFSQTLPISRLQRDLSGSTVMRNIGSAFGYALLAYTSIHKGLSNVELDAEKCERVLLEHPEVITEAIQIILRREGVQDAYEQLLSFSRGKQLSAVDIAAFINGLNVSDKIKAELRAITPLNYIGLCDKLG